MDARHIYKICRKAEYDETNGVGSFKGSADDKRDGFIHLSTSAQLVGTLNKHFFKETNLVLLKIRTENLGSNLKWETSRGGDLFPHFYGDLDMGVVEEITDVLWDGLSHQFSERFLDE